MWQSEIGMALHGSRICDNGSQCHGLSHLPARTKVGLAVIWATVPVVLSVVIE